MSEQQPTSSPNTQTCDETEAWCNMISCIYNFLTSSTNLASILEANYFSTIQEPQVKQQLYLLPPPNPEEFHLSDFPWFLDVLFGVHPENQSSSINAFYMNVSEEVNPLVFSYCSQQETMSEPNQLSPSTSYNLVQGSYETRFVLSSQAPSNYDIRYEAGLTSEIGPNQQLYEDNIQTSVHQELDDYYSVNQTDESSDVNLLNQCSDIDPIEITKETVEASGFEGPTSSSDAPASQLGEQSCLKSGSKEEKINLKDNVSQETYFDEYTESDHTMDLPDSKYESLVEISNENKSKSQLEKISATKLPRNGLLQTFDDFNDIMKSEEIQTVVNKRYNCTLKALITRSAEQQMPWEEVMPNTLEIPRPSLENMYTAAEVEDAPMFINQTEEPAEVQEQKEHEAACSDTPKKEKQITKILSKDLKANKDTTGKNPKNVRESKKNIDVKHSMVKLVNVQLNPEIKGSDEKLAKQLTKNTGPKLKRRNPIIAKKDTKPEIQQIKDIQPSTSKNMPPQKPTAKHEQGVTKITEAKRIIPKQYASVESTVRRFIQEGSKNIVKPKEKPTIRKPVHPNEMKALQSTLDKAKSKVESTLAQKNLSSQPVLFPKQVPNKGSSKIPSASTQMNNFKARSMVVGSTSKAPSRNITKSPVSQYAQGAQKPGASTIANTRMQRKSPIRGGGNLKAKSEVISKKIDMSLQSKRDTSIPSKKQERDSKSQENKTTKRIVLPKVQPTVKKTK